jgi:16S rRNA processing protein RimM
VEEFIAIGVVVRAHGIKGEFQVFDYTDEPEQFDALTSVYLSLNDVRKLYEIETIRHTRDRIILKLKDIDDRTTASNHKGALIERKLSELRPLSDDEYYIHDLVGLRVETDEGVYLGVISNVLNLPANDVYVVLENGRETLIPAIKDCIRKVDIDNGVMIIHPLDGLLE